MSRKGERKIDKPNGLHSITFKFYEKSQRFLLWFACDNVKTVVVERKIKIKLKLKIKLKQRKKTIAIRIRFFHARGVLSYTACCTSRAPGTGISGALPLEGCLVHR
jgi:hypothetical protein